jgi:predicted membrane protein
MKQSEILCVSRKHISQKLFILTSFPTMNAQLVSGKLWVGVLFIVAGVIIFLDQLHLISFRQLFSTWWPLLLLGIGLTKLIARSGSPIVAILLLALGAILQLQRLRLLDIDLLSLILPLALIFGGAAILLSKAKQTATISTDRLNHFAVLGGSMHRVSSSNFQGGSVTAVMGGVELDLRDAVLLSPATIEVTAVMGGVEVRVPNHWQVEVSGTPVLGGIENRVITDSNLPDAPILHINATAVLGGIEIYT